MSELHQDHDLDLIAAFVEGRLDDPAPAEALVAACPECAHDFQSHQTVLEAVRVQPHATLDDLERRRLRAAVWEGIEAEPSPAAAPPVPARKASTPWWYRIAPVAAALVVVVGVSANLVPQGGDSATTEELRTTGPGVDALERPEMATEGTDAADATSMADAPETTAAATATTSGASGGATELASTEMEEAATDFAERAVADSTDVDPEAAECVAGDPEANASAVAAESAVIEDTETWLVGLGTPTEVTGVVVYAADDCRVLYRGD